MALQSDAALDYQGRAMDVHQIPMLEIDKRTGDCFTGMTNAIAYLFMRERDCERNAMPGLMTRGTPLQHQLSKLSGRGVRESDRP